MCGGRCGEDEEEVVVVVIGVVVEGEDASRLLHTHAFEPLARVRPP